MKKFLILIAALALAGGLAAQAQQAKPEPKPDAKAAPNVAGKWMMTLETPMGTGTPALELKQDGEKVTGTYTGRYGTFPLEGALKKSVIEFSVAMIAEGQSITLTFTGEVAADGQTMKGKVAMAEIGEATWSARREKAGGLSM